MEMKWIWNMPKVKVGVRGDMFFWWERMLTVLL